MAATFDANRLYATLRTTGLDSKDPPLYQVIYQLIRAMAGTQSAVASGSGSSSSSSNITNINQTLQILGGDGGDGDSMSIPGPPGVAGSAGATGPSGGLLAFIYEEPEDIFQYPPIVGSQGNPGSTGAAGGLGTSIISDGDYYEETLIQLNQTIGAASSGKLAQVVKSEDGAVATTATTIPFDDTIPQNTEGAQFLSVTITPQNALSTLVINVQVSVTVTGTPFIIVALFQDTTANALAATWAFVNLSTTGYSMTLNHYMTAGTVGATTFKVRIGGSSGTVTFNGQSGGRIFGGVAASSISVTEILP